jgi:hypothetical protein
VGGGLCDLESRKVIISSVRSKVTTAGRPKKRQISFIHGELFSRRSLASALYASSSPALRAPAALDRPSWNFLLPGPE